MNPESDWNGLVCPKCYKTYHAKSHLKLCHPTLSEPDLTCMHLSARQEAFLFRHCRIIAEDNVAETAIEVGFEIDKIPKVVELLKHFGHHISKEETSSTAPQAIPPHGVIGAIPEEDPRTSDTNLPQDISQEAASVMTSEKDQEEQSLRTGSSKPTRRCVSARTNINSSKLAAVFSVRSARSGCPDQGPSQTGTSSTNPPDDSKLDEEFSVSDPEDLITTDHAVIHAQKNQKRHILYKSFPINEPVMQSFTSYLCNTKKLKKTYALKVVARVSRYFFYMQKKVFDQVRPSNFTLNVLKHRNEFATYIKELRDAGISSDIVRRYLGALETFVDFLETSTNDMQVRSDLRYFRQSINQMIQDARKQKPRRNVLRSTQKKWDLSVVRQGYTSSKVKQEVDRILQTAKNVDLNIWSDSTLGVLISERRLVMRYVACGIIQLGLFHRSCVSKEMTLSDFEGARRVGDNYIIAVHKTSSILCLNQEEYNLFKDYRTYVRGTQPEDSTPRRSTFFRMPNGQPLLYPLNQCSFFQPLFGIVRDTAKDGTRLGYTAVNARNALRSAIANEIYRHPDIILISTYLDHCEKCKPLDNEEEILKIRFILDQITASSLKGSSDDHSFTAMTSQTCRLQRTCINSYYEDDMDKVPRSSVSSPLTNSTHSSGDEHTPLSSTLRSEIIVISSNQSDKSLDAEVDFLESFSPILSPDEEDETQSSPVIEHTGAEERNLELLTILTDSSDAMEENKNLFTHHVRTRATSGPGQPANMSDSDEHNFEPRTSSWRTSVVNGTETKVASSPLIKHMGTEGHIPDLFSISTELTDSEASISWSFSRPEDSNNLEKTMASDSTNFEDGFRSTASPKHRYSPEPFRPLANSEHTEGTAGQGFRSDSVDGDCSGSSSWHLKLDVSSDGDDEEEPSPQSPKKRRRIGNGMAKSSSMIAGGKQGVASAELPVSLISGLRTKFCDEFPLRPYGPVPSAKEVTAFLRFHGVTGDALQAVYARNYRALWRAKQRELVVYLNLMQWPRKPSLEEAKQLLKDLNVKVLPSKVLSLYDDFRRRYHHCHSPRH
ncbi:uncharacterized protein [Haliotis asinina]|uniref:uncharacterized protein n=1 Tax=Haliotis asinina TaxID=109174 RepID=UPI003531C646